MLPLAKLRLTLRVEGKQNSLFPEGPFIKCFVIPPNSEIGKNCKKMICLMPMVAVPQYKWQSN